MDGAGEIIVASSAELDGTAMFSIQVPLGNWAITETGAGGGVRGLDETGEDEMSGRRENRAGRERRIVADG